MANTASAIKQIGIMSYLYLLPSQNILNVKSDMKFWHTVPESAKLWPIKKENKDDGTLIYHTTRNMNEFVIT